MQAQTIALLGGILFGLIFGIQTARSSSRRDPIYGNGAAKALHYITASTITALPVTVLACVFTGGFVYALTVALSLGIVLWGSALAFAAQERPARDQALSQKVERGWTEEDARTSGL